MKITHEKLNKAEPEMKIIRKKPSLEDRINAVGFEVKGLCLEIAKLQKTDYDQATRCATLLHTTHMTKMQKGLREVELLVTAGKEMDLSCPCNSDSRSL